MRFTYPSYSMLTKEDYDFNGDIISSAGLGMGYRTPLGQIKLDVGINVRDPSVFEANLYIGQSFFQFGKKIG